MSAQDSTRPLEPTTDPATMSSGRRELSVGTVVGRHVIVQKIGAGAMGVVYAAFDPALERRIALKLLPVEQKESTDAVAQRSLLMREAQAMARLNHPNVVMIHDVGEVDDDVFIAMEFVDGTTLSSWLAADGRSQSEIIAALWDAGRGLSAAHQAGIVHRDFKPDNVLVAKDGRVLVTDFGIARLHADAMPSSEASGQHPLGPVTGVTHARGHHVGTPAYMSPEQHMGEIADARSDQFSFCVALWEALFGERPFEGATRAALAVAVTAGEPKAPPAGVDVSSVMLKALLRGLKRNPAERFDSMEALLGEANPPARRGGRWVFPAAGIALAAAGVGWGAWAQTEPEPCTGAADAIASTWNTDRAAEITRRWAAQGGFGEDVGKRIARSLERYAAGWTEAYTEACVATQVRQERSATMLDASMACLAGRQAALGAAVELLEAPDEKVLRRGFDIVEGLPSVDLCVDVRALEGVEPPPSEGEVCKAVEASRRAYEQAGALIRAGKYHEANEAAQMAVSTAETSGHAPTLARAKSRLSNARLVIGEAEASRAVLLEAHFLSAAHTDAATEAQTAGELMRAASERSDFDEALLWYRHADAALNSIGRSADEDPRLTQLLGMMHFKLGDFEASQTAYSRALELEPNPVSTGMANAYNDLAMLNENEGHYEKALEYHQKALEIRAELGGPRHPDVAWSHSNIGNTLHNQGKFEEARRHFELAIDIESEAIGLDSLTLAKPLNNLGAALGALGRQDEALEVLTRALRIREQHLEPEDPQIASSYKELGSVAQDQGNTELARTYYDKALAILTDAYGPKHFLVGEMYYRLAALDRRTGDAEGALRRYEQARVAFVESFPNGHPFIAVTIRDIGRVLYDQGKYAEAKEKVEEALPMMAKMLGDPHRELAVTYGMLARIAHQQQRDEDALGHWTRAIEIRGKTDDARSAGTAACHLELAKSQLALGQAAEAAAAIESAAAIAAEHPDEGVLQGQLAFRRAQLADAQGDRAEAKRQAELAVEAYGSVDDAQDLAEIQAWLEAR
ncbi:MAG: serine/threonine-protein kinase [Myxococcota bacterium]